ncbi:MAG: ROK family transcriptional regulator [Caulobacterales bacterium]|nr:ROK family transcriptional regulator [Caulobacterales bacterium]
MKSVVKPTEIRRKHAAGAFSGTNLELAGGHNQRVTLQAIRVNSPITRVDLAEMTGLTPPAIANITKKLLAADLIVEAGRVRGGRGQPAKMLKINPDGCFSIGVNIDYDHITIVALDLLGQVRARAARDVDYALPDAVAKFFRRETNAFFNKRGIPRDKVIGIGVAMPSDMGQVALSRIPPSFAVWSDFAIEPLFSDILPLPVYIENDATAAAIGEMQFGHGLRYPTFLYILVTWGLGGGLVLDGVYFRGATGRSGEIAFLPLHGRGAEARALGDVVSLSALYRHLSAKGFAVSTPKEVEQQGTEITPVLRDWTKRAATSLLDPIIDVICLINPDAILIGGRLPSHLSDEIAVQLNRSIGELEAELPSTCIVERAAIADDAPAVGAAILPFSDKLFPTRAALLQSTA